MFEYTRTELGIPIHLGTRINKYFEEDDKAGIELESGEKVTVMTKVRGSLPADLTSELRMSSLVLMACDPKLANLCLVMLISQNRAAMRCSVRGSRTRI